MTPSCSPSQRLAVPVVLLLTAVGCATANKTASRTDEGAAPGSTVARTEPRPAAGPHDGAGSAGRERPEPEPIYYALDSAQLTPESQGMLQGLAQFLRRHPSERVSIFGHTCDLGTTEYNLALGQKRAYAARDYLLMLGVHQEQVATLSYGEEQPADEQLSDSARSKNRRSEFELKVADQRAAR